MKKSVLIGLVFVMFILAISAFASAKAICSDGSAPEKDTREINEGDAKAVNGIKIGVIEGTEALKKLLADIIVDAGAFSVSNLTTMSEAIDLSSKSYTITLINATAEEAEISADGSSGKIAEGESATLGKLKVFISDAKSSSEGGPSAEGIAGLEPISLSTDELPEKKVSVGGKDYVIGLFSTSDESATIEVSKCLNGTISIEGQVETPSVNESANNSADSGAGTNPLLIISIKEALKSRRNSGIYALDDKIVQINSTISGMPFAANLSVIAPDGLAVLQNASMSNLSFVYLSSTETEITLDKTGTWSIVIYAYLGSYSASLEKKIQVKSKEEIASLNETGADIISGASGESSGLLGKVGLVIGLVIVSFVIGGAVVYFFFKKKRFS